MKEGLNICGKQNWPFSVLDQKWFDEFLRQYEHKGDNKSGFENHEI